MVMRQAISNPASPAVHTRRGSPIRCGRLTWCPSCPSVTGHRSARERGLRDSIGWRCADNGCGSQDRMKLVARRVLSADHGTWLASLIPCTHRTLVERCGRLVGIGQGDVFVLGAGFSGAVSESMPLTEALWSRRGQSPRLLFSDPRSGVGSHCVAGQSLHRARNAITQRRGRPVEPYRPVRPCSPPSLFSSQDPPFGPKSGKGLQSLARVMAQPSAQ
jgi:hypothetical protein